MPLVTIRWRETVVYEQTFDIPEGEVDLTDFDDVENTLPDLTDETTWTDHVLSVEDRQVLAVGVADAQSSAASQYYIDTGAYPIKGELR